MKKTRHLERLGTLGATLFLCILFTTTPAMAQDSLVADLTTEIKEATARADAGAYVSLVTIAQEAQQANLDAIAEEARRAIEALMPALQKDMEDATRAYIESNWDDDTTRENSTAETRQKNRRVEMTIVFEMHQDAQSGVLELHATFEGFAYTTKLDPGVKDVAGPGYTFARVRL